MVIPKVSIGMPVFNGEKHLRRALDSLLAQTFTDFELIISDNASTDGTEGICRAYAEKDGRIRYVRQVRNIGYGANFRFVLDEARGEYFMWASHDDERSLDFLSVNLDFLCSHPDFVASTSPVRFENDRFDEKRMGDGSLTGDAPERIAGFLRRWHKNGRFYSLIRKEAIKDCFVLDQYFLGNDWATILGVVCKGKLNRASEGWVVLGRGGGSTRKDTFRLHRRGWLDLFLPFARLSDFVMEASKDFSIRDKSQIMLALAVMNMKAVGVQLLFSAASCRENLRQKYRLN